MLDFYMPDILLNPLSLGNSSLGYHSGALREKRVLVESHLHMRLSEIRLQFPSVLGRRHLGDRRIVRRVIQASDASS